MASSAAGMLSEEEITDSKELASLVLGPSLVNTHVEGNHEPTNYSPPPPSLSYTL